MRVLLVLAVLAASAACATAPRGAASASVAADSATTAELVALFALENQAFRARDTTRIAAAIAPEARFYGEAGVKSRGEILSEMAQAPVSLTQLTLEVREAQAFAGGGLAVLHCLARYYAPAVSEGANEPTILLFRVTRVHERRDGRWVLLTHHTTPLDVQP